MGRDHHLRPTIQGQPRIAKSSSRLPRLFCRFAHTQSSEPLELLAASKNTRCQEEKLGVLLRLSLYTFFGNTVCLSGRVAKALLARWGIPVALPNDRPSGRRGQSWSARG